MLEKWGIPLSNITDYEKALRLHKIDELLLEGKSDSQISTDLGIDIMTVKRNIKTLDALKVANLTPTELADRRKELWLELDKARLEAIALFDKYKVPIPCKLCGGTGVSKQDPNTYCGKCRGDGEIDRYNKAQVFHKQWLDTIGFMMKMYGFDNVKSENTINFNQQFNYETVPEKYSSDVAKKVRDAIIGNHEKKVQDD